MSEQPKRRDESLQVERVDGEAIVYDARHDEVMCLNANADAVWQACDGTRDVAALVEATGLAAPVVERALEQLGEFRLLEDAPSKGMTRRQFGIRAAAGAAAVTMVWAISSPSVAAAQSAPATGTPTGTPTSPTGTGTSPTTTSPTTTSPTTSPTTTSPTTPTPSP